MAMAAAKRQISQETFDECVRENVDEFDMSAEEAVADAVQQFESQGVDLSNVIKRAPATGDAEDPAGRMDDPLEQLVAVIQVLQQAVQSGTVGTDVQSVGEVLERLWELFERVPETKIVAGRHNAVAVLLQVLAASIQAEVATRQTAANVLVAMLTSSTDNQDFVAQEGMQRLASMLQTPSGQESPHQFVLPVVKAACAKHEANKTHFAKANGLEVVCDELLPAARADDTLSKQVAGVLRVLTINDDPNATFSQAQETIKLLVTKDVVPYIIDTLDGNRDKPDLLASWLIVLKQLAITEENCRKIHELEGLSIVQEIMVAHEQNLSVVKRCITVYRNVAAADELKEFILRSGGVDRVLVGMRVHESDASLQQHACATLAAIALRSPENSVKIVELGAARHIAHAMRLHRENVALLRQASLAIRNMVARAVDLRARILEEREIEPLLREAQKFRGCGDEAYAALRDLGCEIQLSSFGVAATSTGIAKPRFNPVHIESNQLMETVEEAAEAPFAARR
jgi:hypothetical protein